MMPCHWFITQPCCSWFDSTSVEIGAALVNTWKRRGHLNCWCVCKSKESLNPKEVFEVSTKKKHIGKQIVGKTLFKTGFAPL